MMWRGKKAESHGNCIGRQRNPLFIMGISFLLVLLFGGCGLHTPEGENAQTVRRNGTVIVENFDFEGNRESLSFSAIPERVIVMRPEILDLFMKLGVEEKVTAVSLANVDVPNIEEYKKAFPQARFYEGEIDRETALLHRPDFIVGWRLSFRKGVLGDTFFWKDRRVPVYIEENSGPIPAVDPFPACTVENEIRFIRNMGRIFQKEEKAEEIVRGIEESMRVSEKRLLGKRKKVLTIEFMKNKIEVFGDKILSGDIIRRLGSENINYETPFISEEELRVSSADVIFLIHHGGKTEEAVALDHLYRGAFKNLEAVKQGRVYPLPYKYICAPNVYTTETIERISKGLEE